MKKSTIYLVAGTLVLALVAFLMTRKTEKGAPKKLDIAGYATPEQLDAEKKRSMMDPGDPIPYPVDEVILERSEGRVRLVREGEGKDAKWKIAEPIDGLAVGYMVDQLVEVFKSPTTRSDARAIKEKDFASFDFEPGRRIGLTLKSKGAVWNGVDLIVGQVVKGEDGEGVKGTWVMVRGDESTAFLLADKDLRTPANKELAELRDKKAFAIEADAISRIEIVPATGARVVLTSETKETPPPEGSAPDAKPTKTTTWTLAEPAMVKGDSSMAGVASSLATLYVKGFVPVDKATESAKKALEGKVCVVSFKVGEQTTTLKIAHEGKDEIWARVEGRNELIELSSHTAKNLCKGLEDLKDKTILDVPGSDITELTLRGEDGPVTIAREGTGWRFVSPALPWAADPGGILSSAARITAQRWARPDEVATARAALATPDIGVVVKTAAATHSVSLSAALPAVDGEPETRWAVLGDVATAEPFLVTDSAAKRFVTSTNGLRQKKLLPDLSSRLAGVTVQLAGSADIVTLEKPSNGGDLTFVPSEPNKVANDETIRTLVSTLGNLEAKTFHDGKDRKATGLEADKCTRIGLRLTDGTSMELLISATTAGEGEVYAMLSGGPLANVPVSVNEYQAKNLQKTRGDFQKDGPEAAPEGTPGTDK
jgi:hypothetical protein